MREGKQGRGKGVDREVAACSKVGKAVHGWNYGVCGNNGFSGRYENVDEVVRRVKTFPECGKRQFIGKG